MVDQPLNALAAPITAAPPNKPTNPWAGKAKPAQQPAGTGASRSSTDPNRRSAPAVASRSPQFQTPNKLTNAGGVPRQVAAGERQLDGTRTPEFSQPQKKPGLAAREAAPRHAGETGMERSMADLADQLHPMKPRRR